MRLAALPVSVAIAVLRYRLYEIDRIISRTIGWALVTGLLLAVFVGIVLLLQELMTGFTQRETVAVVISTLVAFSLFQPVRGRVQRAVDRRFDRGRYDAQRTAEAFADRLRTNVAIDSVIADLSSTVELAIRPSTVSLWLRNADR